MTLGDLNNRITFYTNASTTEYASAQRVIAINKAINDIHIMILQSQDEWDFDDKNRGDTPILTTNLVANQQDYSMPKDNSPDEDDTLKIKRVELTYDGSNWYKASPFDLGEYTGDTTETSLDGVFSKTEPFYAVNHGSLYLYPEPDAAVTAGLKIWISRSMNPFDASDLSTGTASIGFDLQFHDMVALMAAKDFAISKDKKSLRSNMEKELLQYEKRLKQYYGDKQQDRDIVLKPAFEDYN